MQRTVNAPAFQINLSSENTIRRILATLDVITFVTDKPNEQKSIPAVTQVALYQLQQSNNVARGAPYRYVQEDYPTHALYHRDPADRNKLHWHLKGDDLITPDQLHHTLRQLEQLQKNKAFLQRLAKSFVDKPFCREYDCYVADENIISDGTANIANSTFSQLFNQNEKQIREAYANHTALKKEIAKMNGKQSRVANALVNGGVNFLIGVVVALLEEGFNKFNMPKQVKEGAIDLLMMMFALATGGTTAMFRIMLLKVVINNVNRQFGEQISSTTRIATMFAALAAMDTSILSVNGFANHLFNLMTVLAGQITVKVGMQSYNEHNHARFYSPPVHTHTHDHVHAHGVERAGSQEPHQEQKRHDENINFGFKSGFLKNKRF